MSLDFACLVVVNGNDRDVITGLLDSKLELFCLQCGVIMFWMESLFPGTTMRTPHRHSWNPRVDNGVFSSVGDFDDHLPKTIGLRDLLLVVVLIHGDTHLPTTPCTAFSTSSVSRAIVAGSAFRTDQGFCDRSDDCTPNESNLLRHQAGVRDGLAFALVLSLMMQMSHPQSPSVEASERQLVFCDVLSSRVSACHESARLWFHSTPFHQLH